MSIKRSFVPRFALSLLMAVLFVALASPAIALPDTVMHQPTPPHNAIKRDILALYSSREEPSIKDTRLHKYLEMPANHVGLRFVYHDIMASIPSVDELSRYRGIISWFPPGSTMDDPKRYILFINKALDQGLHVAMFGAPSLAEDKAGNVTPLELINSMFKRMGMEQSPIWNFVNYDSELTHIDHEMMQFERRMPTVLPPYQQMHAVRSDAVAYLTVDSAEHSEKQSDLVIISRNGGYVAENYGAFEQVRHERTDEGEEKDSYTFKQWYINPFLFLERVFDTASLPKPDFTTIAGQRIFYGHIDGDGWNNLSEVPGYKYQDIISAEVIRREIFLKYPDFPVTVAPVGAEIDPLWTAHRTSQDVVREIFALPNIEPATHTYSHPFYWAFFASTDHAEREELFLDNYMFGNWQDQESHWRRFMSFVGEESHTHHDESADFYQCAVADPIPESGAPERLPSAYQTPRAFANQRFDLDMEICGSADYIQRLAPPGKNVRLIQWSGDTEPFEAAIRKARLHGMWNINGGDSRFDPEYPSYAWVAPLGLQVGSERQIYASNSNENTYTHDWTGRFYGFKYLLRTINNTETPLRIKPFNVYYHMYSGEKLASLNAIRNNLDFAQQRSFHPIFTTRYAAIANGFYTTDVVAEGENSWRVHHRGALNTIRFDRASLRSVDFSRSEGVIGQRWLQGSLYVYLDEDHPQPLIVLKDFTNFGKYPKPSRPYLVQSDWRVWDLNIEPASFSFTTQGFGHGEQEWIVPWQQEDLVVNMQLLNNDNNISSRHDSVTSITYNLLNSGDGYAVLRLNVKENTHQPARITIRKKNKDAAIL